MIIQDKILSTIEQPFFFYKGKFNKINTKYFIDKIEEGCKADDNNSFKSNIIGGMTNYKFSSISLFLVDLHRTTVP